MVLAASRALVGSFPSMVIYLDWTHRFCHRAEMGVLSFSIPAPCIFQYIRLPPRPAAGHGEPQAGGGRHDSGSHRTLMGFLCDLGQVSEMLRPHFSLWNEEQPSEPSGLCPVIMQVDR